MLFGFVMAVVAGFLLTATKRLPIRGHRRDSRVVVNLNKQSKRQVRCRDRQFRWLMRSGSTDPKTSSTPRGEIDWFCS